MLAFGHFFGALLLTIQASSEGVDREVHVREASLEPAFAEVWSGDREEARLLLESGARRARARGFLNSAEIESARQALESEDATLRGWGLRCLVATGEPLSADLVEATDLAKALSRDPHPVVRGALTKLLALQPGAHQNALSLLSSLRSDRHPGVAREALFALLSAAEESAESERWQSAAAVAIADLLGPAAPAPSSFLTAVETAAHLPQPSRRRLLDRLASELSDRNRPDLIGARALVEAARVEPDARPAVEQALLLEGFLVPLPGDDGRDLPRAGRRRIQRAAVQWLGSEFSAELISKSRELSMQSGSASEEGAQFMLECGLLRAAPEPAALVAVTHGAADEWWSTFFDAIRGRVHEFAPEVLDHWLAPDRSRDLRWDAMRALVTSWSAGVPLVRERFDRILHGEDRDLSLDLFGLLARAQDALAGDSVLARKAWAETDEILWRAWRADERSSIERVRELDQLSRAAPHEAFEADLLALHRVNPVTLQSEARTASVIELCADLVTEAERTRSLWPGGAGEALRLAHVHDEKELERAALAGEDLREIEARLRHGLRAYSRSRIYGWRETLQSTLRWADSVASEDVGKTAAALLAKGGPEGLELLRGTLSEVDLVRIRLEILLSLAPAAEAVGVLEAARAAAELRARYDKCDAELRLRVLGALGRTARAEGLAKEDFDATLKFLQATALDGSQASQLRTAAVSSLAEACRVTGHAEPLRVVASALGKVATGVASSSESALEARLVALTRIATFSEPAERAANTVLLEAALSDVAELLDAAGQVGFEVPEAEIVRAELEREVLLAALAERPEVDRARLTTEWLRQLAGAPAREVLLERLSERKLPRREFVLRAELAGLAVMAELQTAEPLLVPELDARSGLLIGRVIEGSPEFRLNLLERTIVAFVGEPATEEAARFDLEARLRALLLCLEAGGPGGAALEASLRFDFANPERSSDRALELIFFSSESEIPEPERALSMRARALRRLDTLIRTAKAR